MIFCSPKPDSDIFKFKIDKLVIYSMGEEGVTYRGKKIMTYNYALKRPILSISLKSMVCEHVNRRQIL